MANVSTKYLKTSNQPTIPRREAICLILLILLTAGWFTGGREPFGLIFNSLLSVILFGYWMITRPKKTKLAPMPLVLSIGLIGLVTVLSASWLWSINRYASFILASSFLSATAIFIVARDILVDKTAQKFWQILFLASAVVLAIFGIYYFLIGDYNRVISLFYWPNPLAAYLGVAYLLALLGCKKSQNKIYLLLASLFLATTILTYSRAGWLCLALSAVFVVATAKNKKIWLKNILISLIIAAVLAGAIGLLRAKVFHKRSLNLSTRLAETSSTSNTSTSDRVNYWLSAYDIYVDNMWIGVGAGSFGSIYPKYQRQVISATTDPHNFYLQVLAELGLVGFSFVILTFIGLVKVISAAVKNQNETKTIFAAAAGLLLLHAGLDFDFRYPTLVFLTAVLLAVLTSQTAKKAIAIKPWVRLSQVVLLLGMLIALAGMVINFQVESIHENLAASLAPTLSADEMKTGYANIEQAKIKNPNFLADAGAFYFTLAASDKSGKTSFDTAERLARAGIAADRFNARFYFLLANIYHARGQSDKAIEYFKKTIELDPLNNPQYYSQLVDMYIEKKQFRQAGDLVNSITSLYTELVIRNRSGVVQLKNRLAILYNQKAIIEFNLGNKAEAIRAVKRALELAPNYKDAKDFQAQIESR